MTQAHQWRFFRSGGFDQVKLDQISDWLALGQFDPKLWAALSCPAQGLEFDPRTLQWIDGDNDGRIRLPEIRAAVAWSCKVLSDPQVLLSDSGLSISSINQHDDEGRLIYHSALRLLQSLGMSEQSLLTVDLFEQANKIFPPAQANGDGIIPLALCHDDDARHCWHWIAQHYVTQIDRSGEVGIDETTIKKFIADADTYLAWLHGKPSAIAAIPANEWPNTAQALQVVSAKVDDYFSRCQLIAFNDSASNYLIASEADWQSLGKQQLDANVSAAKDLPLAALGKALQLPLRHINPAWQSQIEQLNKQLIAPVYGQQEHLKFEDWVALKALFSTYLTWLQAEPVVAFKTSEASNLNTMRVQADLLLALVHADFAVAEQANALVAVEKIVRFKKNLYRLLRNFVSLADFYHRDQKAIFQIGELFIDGKSTELCLRVNDVAKHAAMASLSGCYLLYCDCSRRGSNENMQIVAAMTGGSAGNLMVGRNGVFFDRLGQDWDATVSKIIDNPISVRDAFWTPYRRVAKLISDQAQKFAADKDKAVQEQSSSQVNASVQHLEKTTSEKTEKPAPFDVAKFAGIFAAIGLAIGAIGTAMAAVVSGFLSLQWWQMPLALTGVLLLVSGPSMLMAYFKLRQRNLAPLLDANGWAVNTNAKITIAFGRALTHSATLPDGAERSLFDPYAEKDTPWKTWIFIVVIIFTTALLWQFGYLQKWFGL